MGENEANSAFKGKAGMWLLVGWGPQNPRIVWVERGLRDHLVPAWGHGGGIRQQWNSADRVSLAVAGGRGQRGLGWAKQ